MPNLSESKKVLLETLQSEEMRYRRLSKKLAGASEALWITRKNSVKTIEQVRDYINQLANTPKDFKTSIQFIEKNIRVLQESIDLEKAYTAESIGNTVSGGAIASVGAAIAAVGPTAAMGIATTFGVASTGTAISTLSGAAATNAALAWLGGGALAAGGGGMAAGSAFLALAGPVGWAIAGVGAFTAVFMQWRSIRKVKASIQKALETVKHFCLETQKQIENVRKWETETDMLNTQLVSQLQQVKQFPYDYEQFSDEQKSLLGIMINQARTLAELNNNKIGAEE